MKTNINIPEHKMKKKTNLLLYFFYKTGDKRVIFFTQKQESGL